MLEMPEERICRSRQTLRGWAWLSAVSTDPDEIVALLGQEVRALGEVAFEHPCHAAAVAEVISGYIALATRLRSDQSPG